ncbi:hypothetical protein P4H71_13795 [Paenibacillus kribbensis]|uniref:hypothetical protein n=1 Tax=Paenibacillus TaxID=44249 RepID=UPI00024F0320|nr:MULTISPECIES: hypothetical protein [Paenibacillus]EHS55078.1 hypothetical protein WG8_4878 [Paenibacillus sp. Aloe-11]MEC0235398.1 hypothetical protein [Paenibacillus kribbensis]
MSVNALTKKIMLSSATAALLFSVVSPFSASAASTSVTSSTYNESANQPEGVVPPVINGTDPSLNGDVTTQGKVSWTIKGIKAALKSQASKIDNVIKTTIDWLPVSDSVKKNLINVVKVDALIKALDVVTDFSGSIEDALSQAMQYLGVAGWLADIIARAIGAIFL